MVNTTVIWLTVADKGFAKSYGLKGFAAWEVLARHSVLTSPPTVPLCQYESDVSLFHLAYEMACRRVDCIQAKKHCQALDEVMTGWTASHPAC